MQKYTIVVQDTDHQQSWVNVNTHIELDKLTEEQLRVVLHDKVIIGGDDRVFVKQTDSIEELKLDLIEALQANHIDILTGLPGDHFNFPIVSNNMPEYRVEFNIDYELADEETEAEDTYFLLFGLFQIDGKLKHELTLNYFVNEAGVQEKHHFKITYPDSWLTDMETLVDKWDMRKDAYGHAKDFFKKLKLIIEKISKEPYIELKD